MHAASAPNKVVKSKDLFKKILPKMFFYIYTYYIMYQKSGMKPHLLLLLQKYDFFEIFRKNRCTELFYNPHNIIII